MIVMAATGVIGLASLLSVGLVVPRWARTRAAQMEHIAARTLDAPDSLPGGGASALPDAR
jgi:hypothetical protein